MRWSGKLVVLVAIGAIGCDAYKRKKVIEEHRAASTAQLAKITALAPIAEAHAPLTRDDWKLPPGVQLDLRPHDSAVAYDGPERGARASYNTAMVYVEQLARPCESDGLTWQHHDRGFFFLSPVRSNAWLIDPACALETGSGMHGAEIDLRVLDDGLRTLARTKYVLVLRLRERTKPNLVMAELIEKKMESFKAGRVAGDALLFDVEARKYLAGFVIDASNSETVSVRDKDVHGQLESELLERTRTLIEEKLAHVGAAL
jgi:hypothetical protein